MQIYAPGGDMYATVLHCCMPFLTLSVRRRESRALISSKQQKAAFAVRAAPMRLKQKSVHIPDKTNFLGPNHTTYAAMPWLMHNFMQHVCYSMQENRHAKIKMEDYLYVRRDMDVKALGDLASKEITPKLNLEFTFIKCQ